VTKRIANIHSALQVQNIPKVPRGKKKKGRKNIKKAMFSSFTPLIVPTSVGT